MDYYYFTATFPGDSVPLQRLKGTPPAKIDQDKWGPFTTTFHEPDGSKDFLHQYLFNILAKMYDFGGKIFKEGNPQDHFGEFTEMLGTGTLTSDDGLQIWNFEGLWPHSVNFGDLCYSSSSEVDIEVTWRCKECKYTEVTNLLP